MAMIFDALDREAAWSYRVVGLSLFTTLLLFLLLPIAEMIHQKGKPLRIREVETRDVMKPPPVVPPRTQRKQDRPKPKWNERPKVIDPMMIQAALQVAPGGDFDLQFGLQGNISQESLIFDLADVDANPALIRKVDPIYPARARMKKITGHVEMIVVIEKDGHVGSVEVKSAEPPGYFENSAVKAVSQWQYEPAKRNGENVRLRVVFSVDFE